LHFVIFICSLIKTAKGKNDATEIKKGKMWGFAPHFPFPFFCYSLKIARHFLRSIKGVGENTLLLFLSVFLSGKK
jgi:hypothetical protein